MPFHTIAGGTIYWKEHGAGEPLLFVTGLNGVASHWAPQVEAFAPHFRVITYDQLGCGKSSAALGENSIARMAGDLIELLDGLGIGAVHFAGHSTGGAIGQLIAARHPERIRRLALLSSWAEADLYFRKVMTMRRTLLCRAGIEEYVRAGSAFLYPPDWMEEHKNILAAGEANAIASFRGVETVSGRIDAVLAFTGTAFLPAIRAPTLVATADDDILTPPRLADALAQGIAGAALAILKGGGHMFTALNAEALNPLLLRFFGSRK